MRPPSPLSLHEPCTFSFRTVFASISQLGYAIYVMMFSMRFNIESPSSLFDLFIFFALHLNTLNLIIYISDWYWIKDGQVFVLFGCGEFFFFLPFSFSSSLSLN
jgi:hypothetical protein